MKLFQISSFGLGMMYAALGAVLFSSKAIFIKLGYQESLDVMTVLILRGVIAVPIFFLIALYVSRQQANKPVTISDKLGVVVMGFFGYYLSSVLDFYGLKYTPASLERMIFYVYPTLVLVLGSLIFRRRILPVQRVALVLTYGGLALVLLFQSAIFVSMDLVKGVGFVFLSTVSYAIYILFSGQLIPRIGAVRYTAWVMMVSYGFVGIHYIYLNGFYIQPIGQTGWILMVLLGVMATVLPTILISKAIGLIGSSNTVLSGAIGPVSTVLMAHLFLHESLDGIQYGGIFLVLLGIFCLNRWGNNP